MEKKKAVKIGMMTVSATMVFYMLHTYTWAASVAFFKGDDFDHAIAVGEMYTSLTHAIGCSWDFMVEIYETWQGTYFAMFCQALLSPLNGSGIEQLRTVMVANVGLIFLSVFFLIYAISKYVFGEIKWHYLLPVYALAMFGINAYKSWEEIYYWFSGATSYSIPLIFLFIALSLYLMCSKSEKKVEKLICGIGSMICIFLASGGSLEVAGTGCYLVLIVLLMEIWKTKKVDMLKCNIFLAGFFGALLNTLAPGNYVRYEEIDASGTLHIQEALERTIDCVKEEVDWLMNGTSFLAILLIVLILGTFASKYIHYSTKEMGMFFVALLLTPLVTVFPVMVAYDSYFPNRCQFVLDVVMVLIYAVVAFGTGCFMKSVFKEERETLQFAVICAIIAAVSFSGNEDYNVEDLIVVQTRELLANEEIQSYSEQCMMIYDYIAYTPYEEVAVEYLPIPVANYASMALTNDPNFWLNLSIARYYGKDAVWVVNYY